MNSYITASNDTLDSDDFEILPGEIIDLNANHFIKAKEATNQIAEESKKWVTYTNTLAVEGFCKWVQQRDSTLEVKLNQCRFIPPTFVNWTGIISNLSVGSLKVCLIVHESDNEDTVSIPKATVGSPDLAAHIYILASVLEEEEAVLLHGFIQFNNLKNLVGCSSSFLEKNDQNQMCEVEFNQFNDDLDSLLLYLRFSEKNQITLPEKPQNLAGLRFLELTKLFAQSFTNMATVLRHTLESNVLIVEDWTLPQSYNFAPAMRDQEPWNQAIADIVGHTGISIPSEARFIRHEPKLELNGIPIELWAGTWLCPLKSNNEAVSLKQNQDWQLLLLLLSSEGWALPQGVGLRVSDASGVCTVRLAENQTYLYNSASGNQDEAFVVTVYLDETASITLPAFRCITGALL